MDTLCSCHNCFKLPVAKGLCETHYKRWKRHGNVNNTRPADWGLREKHPLYNTWSWMRRQRGRHEIQKEWDDFWVFVQDIKDRPTEKHQLRKLDETLGYTKNNLVWKEVIPSQDAAKYQREWRKQNPDKVKSYDLKRMFGLSLDEYNQLKENQNYSCKICGKHEDDCRQNLVVDHCHTTGKVRGLLCDNCNRGLGFLQDSSEILKKAQEYLSGTSVPPF